MNTNRPIHYDMDMARTSYRVLNEVQTSVKGKCLVSDEKHVPAKMSQQKPHYMNDPNHFKILGKLSAIIQN